MGPTPSSVSNRLPTPRMIIDAGPAALPACSDAGPTALPPRFIVGPSPPGAPGSAGSIPVGSVTAASLSGGVGRAPLRPSPARDARQQDTDLVECHERTHHEEHAHRILAGGEYHGRDGDADDRVLAHAPQHLMVHDLGRRQ